MTEYNPDDVSHPGETLGEVIKAKDFSQTKLAATLGLSLSYISDVIRCKRPISLPLALKLEKLDGFPKAEFWLTRQMHYDLFKARHG